MKAWKDWSSWLKGGIRLSVIYIILSAIIHLILFLTSTLNTGGF